MWRERWKHLELIDSTLAKAGIGYDAITPWWSATLAELYRARPTTATLRVGRRGRKSSTWCRVALSECTHGLWAIPPGETGVFQIVSADRSQATDRVSMIAAMAEACGIEHVPYRQQIRFPDFSTAVMVSTASTSSVVSRTSVGAFFDEMALWRDDSGANPAKAIIEAFRPSLLTMPGAYLAMISAPWSTTDPHSTEFARTGRGRYRAHAPTWVANPHVTEDECRELCDSEDEFMRQYAAEPLDSYADALYPVAAVRAAMGMS